MGKGKRRPCLLFIKVIDSARLSVVKGSFQGNDPVADSQLETSYRDLRTTTDTDTASFHLTMVFTLRLLG